MIDTDGFRANVGIIIINKLQEVFWGGRVGQEQAWQFPQGGINDDEKPEQAMFRELYEEVGLLPDHVKILGQTENWLRYRLPKKYMRYHSRPLCVGQKQKWFLLELTASESSINFDNEHRPEFDRWCWVDYWYPVDNVIEFKRRVYKKALTTFKPIVFGR